MSAIKFLKSRDVRELRRHGATKLWTDIKRQLLPPPIKRGPRERLWPEAEIDAILRAELRGAPEEERRELVRSLIEARKRT